MSLIGKSQNLFGVLKELLRIGGRRISKDAVSYLVAFVVAAIVLDVFIVTAFAIIVVVIRMIMGF